MRVYFDASVIIATLLSPSGGSSVLLKFIKAGIIIGITSQTVLEEILEEDKPKKFKKSKKEIEHFIAESNLLIRKSISMEEIEPYLGMIETEDAHLIAGANLTKCTYLVSLDKKDVLRPDVQKKFQPLKIVSPKDLIEKLVA